MPPRSSSVGVDAIKLSSELGLELDPWQRHVLTAALGRGADGSWSALDVGLCAPRQVGKTSLLIPRAVLELLERSRTVIWSAHETATALEGFGLMRALLEESELADQVARVVRSKGFEEAIELVGAVMMLVGLYLLVGLSWTPIVAGIVLLVAWDLTRPERE